MVIVLYKTNPSVTSVTQFDLASNIDVLVISERMRIRASWHNCPRSKHNVQNRLRVGAKVQAIPY